MVCCGRGREWGDAQEASAQVLRVPRWPQRKERWTPHTIVAVLPVPGEPHKYSDTDVLFSKACEIEPEIFTNACALHGKREGSAAFGCNAAKAAVVLSLLIAAATGIDFLLYVGSYACSAGVAMSSTARISSLHKNKLCLLRL